MGKKTESWGEASLAIFFARFNERIGNLTRKDGKQMFLSDLQLDFSKEQANDKIVLLVVRCLSELKWNSVPI